MGGGGAAVAMRCSTRTGEKTPSRTRVTSALWSSYPSPANGKVCRYKQPTADQPGIYRHGGSSTLQRFYLHWLHVHRSANQLLLKVPKTRLKLRGDRTFSVVPPKLCKLNKLLLHIRPFDWLILNIFFKIIYFLWLTTPFRVFFLNPF